MILSIPIFLCGSQIDWKSREMQARLEHVCRQCLRVRGIDSVAVVSDNAELAGLAGEWGVHETFVVPAPGRVSFPDQVALFASLAGDSPLVGVNFRNPALSAERISEAISLYCADSRRPVVSMSVPEDHPAHLRMHLEELDAGMLHVLEDSQTTAVLARRLKLPVSMASRPFPLDAEMVPESVGEESLFVPSSSGFDCMSGTEASSSRGSVWYRESGSKARILWLGVARPASLAACPATYDGEAFPGVVLHVRNGAAELTFAGAPGRCMAHLQPVSEGGVSSVSVRRLMVEDGRCAAGTVEPDHVLFIHSVERVCREGRYDYERAYDPCGVLWSAETSTLANGDKLYGRQNMPVMYQVHPSLCVGRADQLLGLRERMREGAFQGLMLDQREAVLLESELDCIRLRIIEEMEERHAA